MRAVIFGLGGTVTPWRTVDPQAGWQAYSDVVCRADPERAAGRGAAVPLAERAASILRAEEAEWTRARDEHLAFTIEQVLEAAGVPAVEAAFVAYRASWEHATFTDPEAAPLINALRDKGLRTGVLSSTSWPGA